MRRSNAPGFTLIELLVVLAIIGILSAIAIPALLGQRARAKAKSVESMVSVIAGECARVSDTLREEGQSLLASQIAGSVLTLSNYQYPAAKNPYGGTLTPYVMGAPSRPGEVGLRPSSVYTDPITGQICKVIVIEGQLEDPGTGVLTSLAKVVAVD
jgi:prepilin-type N-terminal cleavage/methylation domain-containing protein